ncbi:CopD family protein [Moheibacter lacus]|uniref:Protoporphyrinogen IX oxidase n=1 Tax=Moheibacter lacus TaxID=2745851 RepID=A0A838ZKN1_9FLAO|nr:CopD family protein [Moheibacter lacus]MBA5628230.1 CopD family protein [Moheibacter lacus]
MEFYPIIKAIHIIFVVSYFAGLFYIVRLFIYHTETQNNPESEQSILRNQFRLMERKLWNIITVPAGILVLITGITMLFLNQSLLTQPWMHIKLTAVLLLIGYHLWSWKTLKEIQQDQFKMKSVRLRMMNEVATLLLFIIVFAVILKGLFLTYWYWILISFVGVGVLIMLIVRLVNRKND